MPLFVSLSPGNSGLSSLNPWPNNIARGDLSLDHAVQVPTDTFDHWWRATGSPAMELDDNRCRGGRDPRAARHDGGAQGRGRLRAVVAETVPGGEFDEALRRRGFVATTLEDLGPISNRLYALTTNPA